MSTSTQPLFARHAGLATRTLAAATTATRAVLAFVRALNNRGDVRLMLDMDERALKDMGLTRNDVLGALAQPLIADPSRILSVRSIERRGRSRALDIEVARATARRLQTARA